MSRLSTKFRYFFTLALLVCTSIAWAVDPTPPALKSVGVDEHLGARLPVDVTVVDASGKRLSFQSLFSNGRPKIFSPVYFGCPQLCQLITNNLSETINGLPKDVAASCDIISFSFNDADSVEEAAAFQAHHVSQLKYPELGSHWYFVVASQNVISEVTNALGFRYNRVGPMDFAHPAVVVTLSPKGNIMRYLYGISYTARDLKLAILEAKAGTQKSTVDKIWLYCYAYDANSRGYVLQAMAVMRIGGALTLIALVFGIGWLNWKGRKK